MTVFTRCPLETADFAAGSQRINGPGALLVGRAWSCVSGIGRQAATASSAESIASTVRPLLDILAWGGDPRAFEWFEPPSDEAIAAGLELLDCLGAIAAGQLTAVSARMHALPLHPRLARLFVEANGARLAALACALLSERRFVPQQAATTTSDLLSAVDRERDLPQHVLQTARALQRAIGVEPDPGRLDERAFRRAVFHGYPDRVGRRRQSGLPRVLLASGHGAVLSPESGVRDGEFVVAIDVHAGRRGDVAPGRRSPGGGGEAKIRMASIVDREWLAPSRAVTTHEFDRDGGRVRAFRRDYYGAIVLAEQQVPPDSETAAALLRDAYVEREWRDADEQLARRLRFADVPLDMTGCSRARGSNGTGRCRSHRALTRDERQRPRPRSARAARRPERSHARARVSRRRDSVSVGQAAGVVRPRGDTAHRSTARAGAAPPACPERPARANDARPSKFLGTDLPGGEKGIAGAIPEASVAGRSVDCDGYGADAEAAVESRLGFRTDRAALRPLTHEVSVKFTRRASAGQRLEARSTGRH